MSENRKNRNMLAEFFRYIRDELSGRERNSFERGLQKDPFAEEAMDGFSMITEQEAADDISELNARLRRRIAGKRSSVYRIAGIAVLFFALASLIVVSIVKRPNDQLAISTPPDAFEILKNQPVVKSDSKEDDKTDRAREENKSTRVHRTNTKQAVQNADSFEMPAGKANNDIIAEESESIASKDELSREIVSAPMAAMSRKKQTSQDSIVSSPSTLSEVVVIGYSSGKSDNAEKNISEYVHPQPVSGKSKFDEYIKNNLHRPENADASKKAVVVLSFLVRTSGQIDSIRIIKSPGKEYSDEAIRVIKSGPAWMPAQDSGKAIEEDVRLRIVFR
jgi:hypothetical protein